MTVTPVAAVVLLLLTAACGALGAWGLFTFRRLLPLERERRALRVELDDLRVFAAEILDLEPAARRPAQALADSAGRILGAVQRRAAGTALAAFARGPEGAPTLLAHRGGPWAKPDAAPAALDAGFLGRAAESGEARWDLGADGAPTDDETLKTLYEHGFTGAVAVGWSDERGAGAIIAALSGRGNGLERARPFLEMARAGLRAVAAVSSGMAQLAETRERLQGGLSAAMEELTQTHDRLIRKSREVKTLHDVATTLSTRTSQAPSTLGAIVSIVARAMEADLVAFLILDETTGELVTQPGAHGLEGEELLYRLPLSDERSSSVRVFKTRQPFVTSDAQNDPQVIARYAKMWRVHSLMVVPLVVEDRCIGVMRVGSRRKEAFGTEQLSLVSVIADEAAIIVETAILNRRLSRTAEQLAALNRMKDEFVSTVSHEFKTPLTTISGFLTVMLDGEAGPLNAQQMKFLNIAKSAAKRLSGLVSDLLDLSRLEGGAKMELKPLELDRLVTSSAENFQPVAGENGKTLSVEAPVRLPRALGDERWLALVVDNLISNALKFSHPGGRVRVRVQDKGEFLMVSVTDDGIGVPAQDRDRLFERFYRASNRTEVNAPGTGLGLSIAREVVSKHGGKIWFESETGAGTTFHFVVPAAPREEVPVA